MNWYPVADDFDMALLQGIEFAPEPENHWSLPPQTHTTVSAPDVHSPIYSLSSSTSQRDLAQPRPKPSEARYVDGYGARHSLQKAPRLPSTPLEMACWQDDDRLGFPDSCTLSMTDEHNNNNDDDAQDDNTVTVDFHATLLRHFHALCLTESVYHRCFDSPNFPDRSHLAHYFRLYVEHLAPHFPIVHHTTWSQPPSFWPLALAALTVGASFGTGMESPQIVAALREFLRRAVRWSLAHLAGHDPSSVAQTAILQTIAQFDTAARLASASAIADLRLAMAHYRRTYRRQCAEQIDPSQHHLLWEAWILEETHRRLRWYSWLVETMSMLLFGGHPGEIALPVDDDLAFPAAAAMWKATTPLEARSLLLQHRDGTPCRLREALHATYVKRVTPHVLDDNGQILLTYALVARLHEVAHAVQQALYGWHPTPLEEGEPDDDGDDDDDDPSHIQPQWLPANSHFASWRNSTCDCFDQVHWAANSQIASRKGLEKPIILHLHLARLFLLCPYRDIVALAARVCGRAEVRASHLNEALLKWLTLDDHKGRLSLIHAGAVFWHLRRYSLGLFYEPFAIYVASLVLWIYGYQLPQVREVLVEIKTSRNHRRVAESSRPPASASSSGGGGGGGGGGGERGIPTTCHTDENGDGQGGPGEEDDDDDDDDDLMPDRILLDRPCDDEIVQAFVRRGYEMQAEMSGAGDICTARGRRRVLEEGMKLLRRSQYANLETARRYARELQKLVEPS
jgi:hypothetical protein